MPESPNPGQSYEAWIESKAGACPPGAPVWRCSYGDDTGVIFLEDGAEEFVTMHRPIRVLGYWREARDWPMPSPPPFPADDEDDEAPDE